MENILLIYLLCFAQNLHLQFPLPLLCCGRPKHRTYFPLVIKTILKVVIWVKGCDELEQMSELAEDKFYYLNEEKGN